MNDFEILLSQAILQCEGMYLDDFSKNFSLLYSFTTENITGYIKHFDLRNRTLLTVGSSGDQIINAGLYGCQNITLLDINPYSKFYPYLKLATLLECDRMEFLNFLRYKDFPKRYKKNRNILNKETYEKIKTTLRLLDYESYLLWDKLLSTFPSIQIKENLFYTIDEGCNEEILGCNTYLESDINYQEAKEKLKKVQLTFINGNVFDVKLPHAYDNIWLSNIGTYHGRHLIKTMVDNMSQYLNQNGQLLISYLYQTTEDTKYQSDWAPIYDLEKTMSILGQYHPKILSFVGIQGLKFKDNSIKDSILVYKKQ